VYQYTSPLVTGDTINGQLRQLDLMPGCQIVRGAATLGGYAGFDYQESSLRPDDPTNPVRGTATGVKVEGHYYFADEKQPLDASLVGEYSTAFDTYYAELRVGARICEKLFIGPDAEVDGDTGYNAWVATSSSATRAAPGSAGVLARMARLKSTPTFEFAQKPAQSIF
jgi:Cellulose biosynthesis protein BcsS